MRIPFMLAAGLVDAGWKLFDPDSEPRRFRAKRCDDHRWKRSASNNRKAKRQKGKLA